MRRFEWLEPSFLWAAWATVPLLSAAQMNSAPAPSSGSWSQLSVTVLDENGVAIRSALGRNNDPFV
jgi:hypothetical protein